MQAKHVLIDRRQPHTWLFALLAAFALMQPAFAAFSPDLAGWRPDHIDIFTSSEGARGHTHPYDRMTHPQADGGHVHPLSNGCSDTIGGASSDSGVVFAFSGDGAVHAAVSPAASTLCLPPVHLQDNSAAPAALQGLVPTPLSPPPRG